MSTCGGLAQLVECALCKREAPGSKPGFSTSSWSYSVMVITLDFESSDPGSNPGRTFFGQFFNYFYRLSCYSYSKVMNSSELRCSVLKSWTEKRRCSIKFSRSRVPDRQDFSLGRPKCKSLYFTCLLHADQKVSNVRSSSAEFNGVQSEFDSERFPDIVETFLKTFENIPDWTPAEFSRTLTEVGPNMGTILRFVTSTT